MYKTTEISCSLNIESQRLLKMDVFAFSCNI